MTNNTNKKVYKKGDIVRKTSIPQSHSYVVKEIVKGSCCGNKRK